MPDAGVTGILLAHPLAFSRVRVRDGYSKEFGIGEGLH